MKKINFSRKRFVKGVLVAAVVAALLMLTVSVLAAAGGQQWFLFSDDHATAGKVMKKTGTPSGSVIIPTGGEQLWLAENPAQSGGVTFPGSDFWIIHLSTDLDVAECITEVGYYDGGSFNSFGLAPVYAGKSGDNLLTVKLQGPPQTIPGGAYLALKVTNKASEPRTVTTDGCSWLQSPCNDPGYPVPELSGLALLGAGFLGLGGYLVIRRRKGSPARA